MAEKEQHDRPTRHLFAASAPQFQNGEQRVGDGNCCHYGRAGYWQLVNRADGTGGEPDHGPRHSQDDRHPLAFEITNAAPNDSVSGGKYRVSNHNRPKVRDRVACDDQRRGDGGNDESRSPQSKR